MTITALIKAIEDKEVVRDGFHLNDYEYGFNCGLAAAISSVEDELICCKDCKHYILVKNPWRETKACNRWADLLNTREDDYCSYAERKDNER